MEGNKKLFVSEFGHQEKGEKRLETVKKDKRGSRRDD